MSLKSLVTLFILAFIVLLSSCYYDVEEELYPGDICDTSSVSFANQISTTIATYCLSCHSQASASSLGGGIAFSEYSGVKAQVDNGKLISAVTHDGSASSMPKGAGTKIPSCDISFLRTWIAAGAPNN